MGGRNSAPFLFWASLGSLMALVMPLTAVYTAMSVQIVADDSAPIVMLVILAIISFAAHVLILFGGKLAHEAKTYCLFTSKHTRLTNQLAADYRLVRARLKRLEHLFIGYTHHWRKHNSVYEYVEAGPFDTDVADLLRRHFPHLNKHRDDGPQHT